MLFPALSYSALPYLFRTAPPYRTLTLHRFTHAVQLYLLHHKDSSFHLHYFLDSLKNDIHSLPQFYLVIKDVRGEDKLGGIAELIQKLIDSGDVLGCQVTLQAFI